MRNFEAGFAAHLESGATRLANCWRIARADGVVLGFTDHDLTLRFGGVDFVPAHGLDGREAVQKLGAQVDTGEVLGVLHAEAVTEEDILLGRYDGAVVETWRVNWTDVGQRALLRRDTIGEIVREDGVFRAELRSGQHALGVTHGRVYQPLCDARLGDGACGVALEQAAYRGAAVVAEVRDSQTLAVTGLEAFASGWFGHGRGRWTGGKRLGLEDAVLTHRREGGIDVLGFDAKVGEWVAVGDGLTAYAGCDRLLATCRDKFANTLNFRGFPHIPGSDFVLRHPRAGERLDGRPVMQ